MWLRNRGFTLIEMLIVVAIIAILAGITYPSYQEYLRKGRRADARTVLLQAQQFIERSYTANLAGGYVDATDALPEGLRRAPLDGSKIYYRIGFMGGVTATSYMLSATPLDSQFSDTCGTLTLTNAGQKGADGKTDTATIDRCWR